MVPVATESVTSTDTKGSSSENKSVVQNGVTTSTLEKLESFLMSNEYNDMIENASSYNNRLGIERRMRLPWLDSHTGVAQNHSSLMMSHRQRMPPIMHGQIYTYPRARWRKKRRQYLMFNSRMYSRATEVFEGENESLNPMENSMHDNDSKDSQLKDDAKEWYYDEQDMLELETFDEPDADSDLDYEESYSKRRNRRRPAKGRGVDSPSTPKSRSRKSTAGSSSSRKKPTATPVHFDPAGDTDKPYACDLCNARYKTRPGLTYHYSHTHKEPQANSDENSRDSPNMMRAYTPSSQLPGSPQPPLLPTTLTSANSNAATSGPPCATTSHDPKGALPGGSTGSVYQDSYVTFLNHPGGGTPGKPQRSNPIVRTTPAPSSSRMSPDHDSNSCATDRSSTKLAPPNTCDSNSNQSVGSNSGHTSIADRNKTPDLPHNSNSGSSSGLLGRLKHKEGNKAAPSPYCDFCLGDAKENKKTGTSEQLVSCSDCGRSGHPTCLQFTANMIVSVRKYRWQCIECKCCSICGTSDNDDQLLFCDDCDRGYHMYCLKPPLETPPEGSWSCKLCLIEFHNSK